MMPKEYKTIQEVAGPLMVVDGVEGVTYDELGEIELPNGEIRRCKVLEVDGDNAVGAAVRKLRRVSTLPTARSASWAIRMELAVSRGHAGPRLRRHGPAHRRRPRDSARDAHGHQRPADEPGSPRLPARVYPDRRLHHRRSEHPGPRPEAADLLRLRSAARQLWPRRSRVRQRCSATTSNFAVVFAAIGITFEESEYFIEDFRRTGAIDRTVLFIEPGERPCRRAYRHPAYGADRGGVSGL